MKRLILCCDGTWHGADGGRNSNVLHITRAIRPRASDGVTQVVFYQPGLGHGEAHRFSAALTGAGIDRDILDAYRFLVHNYDNGDEIWCFGYSRGAYTMRSLVGLLRNAWLLHKRESRRIPDAYHIYRTLWGPDADNATRFRERWCREVAVRWLGVWETVGALGIPIELFDELNRERYSFHDTRLSRIVAHARHALAIDERRDLYAPTIWHTRHGRGQTEQSWFSGSHADVGGGHHQGGLAAISLQWLAEEANRCGLDLDWQYLEGVYSRAGDTTVHRSDRGIWKAFGRSWRPIGKKNHDETVHGSAERRYLSDPEYRPQNLKAWIKANDQLRLPL